MQNTFHIKPRYYRWHVNEGVEWTEANTGYASLNWDIPLSRAALILLDVWPGHYLAETSERIEKIIEDRIRPLVAGCRSAGLQVIHAPSPGQAKQHPERMPGPVEEIPVAAWPPEDFRAKRGEFSEFARPFEPRNHELEERTAHRTIHQHTLPEGNDVVVATGEQLHRYCEEAGLLFLIYVGFNTNACMVVRDYGIPAMSARGYTCILLRDCTTGMESAEGRGELRQTREVTLMFEMFGAYTSTSGELLAGLAGAKLSKAK